MTKLKKFRGNQVDVARFSYENGRLVAAALISDSNTSDLLAETECASWGKEVTEIFKRLLDAMEMDIANQIGSGSHGEESITDVLGEVE